MVSTCAVSLMSLPIPLTTTEQQVAALYRERQDSVPEEDFMGHKKVYSLQIYFYLCFSLGSYEICLFMPVMF